MKNLPEAIQHVEEFLRDNLETESCNTQHKELLGFLKELQARRSTPLYSPVKPEDITDGWYWHKPSADDDAEIVYIRCEDGTFGMDTQDRFITVLELYMWGGVLFRIPELPDLEVPE